MDMDKCGVYLIRCEPTGRRYVGASTHITKRLREHFYRLERGVHRNRHMQSAYDEYGRESFSSEVLLYCDPTNVELYGKQMIEKLRPEFNIVHIQNIKRETHRSFRKLLKDYDEQTREIKELERMVKMLEKR